MGENLEELDADRRIEQARVDKDVRKNLRKKQRGNFFERALGTAEAMGVNTLVQ